MFSSSYRLRAMNNLRKKQEQQRQQQAADNAAKQQGYNNATEQKNVEAGNGRMVDGQYVQYTEADKEHLAGASENKTAEYRDLAMNSQLGRYTKRGNRRQGNGSPEPIQRRSLLGGFTPLGV